MSSEQEPLLPSSNPPEQPEQADQSPQSGRLSTWRVNVGEALESAYVHKLVISLVRVFSSHPLPLTQTHTLLQIVIDAVCVLIDLGYTLLSPDCETPGGGESPEWLEVLSLISTIITTLFLVEIPLTLWSLGFEFYNPRGPVTHATLHVFDAIIILTTFVLEVVLRGKERELAGLLIILRLWRLLKLVGGE